MLCSLRAVCAQAGLAEASTHVAKALEMSDTGSGLQWRALFTQLRLSTRLGNWAKRGATGAVTRDFLRQAAAGAGVAAAPPSRPLGNRTDEQLAQLSDAELEKIADRCVTPPGS
jgi:hypothetical protein